DASASPNILSWKSWRESIHARSSFGCTAKTRVVGWAARAVAAQHSRTSEALSQVVQRLRKLEVLFRDPVLGVTDQRDAHEVPGDEQIRVMVHLVRNRGQPAHEVDRAGEVVELELAAQRVSILLPICVQLAELGLDIFIAQ